MSAPRVAVVVPCFNYGRFLPETLASVARQESCELVVVDDGSDDPGTLALLDELRRDGTTVVRQHNQGLSAARMAGVAATSAPYVHVLDADDLLPDGTLTALADALDAGPGLGAAWGHYETFGAESCVYPAAWSLDPWRITYISEIVGTTLVRREAIERTGGWCMGSGYEDWDFWMALAEHGYGGTRVDRVTLRYRKHGGSMYQGMAERHAATVRRLRERHGDLFAARRHNGRRSPAPRAMKLLFGLVGRLPLPELRRYQLYMLIRHYTDPRMSSSGYATPARRARRRLRALRERGR